MIFAKLPIFQALKSKMAWHQARQTVLAENIANADTPHYRGMDLRAPDLKKTAMPAPAGLKTQTTHAGHIAAAMPVRGASPSAQKATSFEITPDANTVVLEEQMMKATTNQLDYQMAATLYSKNIGLLKTALGRGR